MTAYYNEIDPYAAQWLRNLIAAGLIPAGEVDERSIVDLAADDLRGFTQCHFFAGIGGWSYALRQAGWPDSRPVWTGSCPCQPFSAAGKQKGFADDRHLWPAFRSLIEVGRPPVVFGEQVASATAWLGLVRGDLEALGYAVGAMPIQAASAGADHLRDRFWFVADDGSRRRDGPRERQGEQPGRAETIGAGHSNGVGLADADKPGSQGRRLLPECANERPTRQDGVADSDLVSSREGREQRSGQQCGASGDPQARNGSGSDRMADSQKLSEREPSNKTLAITDCGEARAMPSGSRAASDLPDTERTGLRGERPGEASGAQSGVQGADGQRERLRTDTGPVCLPKYEWVIGADGKARRVKPGVRLLAHGIPNRVGKLRGFGNAIDPRPAAAFIKAAQDALTAA